MKRTSKFLIRLTEVELKSLDKKVKSTGMSREGYIRTLLNGYAPISVPPMDFFTMINELRAIGNNMNQIAHRAHTLSFIDVAYYEENVTRVLKMCDYIFSLHLPRKAGDLFGHDQNMGGSQQT
jgi:hypothetical protein